MSTVNELRARTAGPTIFAVRAVAADIQVVVDEGASHAWVQVSTPDQTGVAADIVNAARLVERRGEITLELNEDRFISGRGTNQTQWNNFGNVSFGNGQTVINGVSMINGVMMGPIVIRAILPPGSELEANSTSGDVVSKGVEKVNARTVSGDIEAEGITRDSSLNTVSGDVEVASGARTGGWSRSREVALPSGGPRINANTVSGDVTGYGVKLRAHTVSGRIRER